MLFFYIRHADPIYRPDSLTPLGQRQSAALAKRLALYGIDKIYSSTAMRALETATPTAELTRIKEITQLDWAKEHLAADDFMLPYPPTDITREWCFEMPEYREMFHSEEVRSLGMEWYKHPFFKNTTFEAGIKRISDESDAFFASLGYEHDHVNHRFNAVHPTEERVALFAHQGFSMAFLSLLLDIPYPMFASNFNVSHTGMTVVEFKNQDGIVYPRMLQLSNDSHLYREGIPTKYCNGIYF